MLSVRGTLAAAVSVLNVSMFTVGCGWGSVGGHRVCKDVVKFGGDSYFIKSAKAVDSGALTPIGEAEQSPCEDTGAERVERERAKLPTASIDYFDPAKVIAVQRGDRWLVASRSGRTVPSDLPTRPN